MVMGPERGLALVNRLDRVESLIIVRKQGDQLVEYSTKGFNDE
jgi:hypothetical protein